MNKFAERCRLVNTAVKCFHDVKTNIRQRCLLEGAQLYQQHYIRPLVDQTRHVVLSQCSMSRPYIDYYNSIATSVLLVSRNSAFYFCSCLISVFHCHIISFYRLQSVFNTLFT
jgi:hypothetical protein